MRNLLAAAFLLAVALKPSSCQECPVAGIDSYLSRKENASTAVLTNIRTIATSVVPGLPDELGNGSSTNTSDLYDALTIALDVEDNSSFQSFSGALEEITDAYFLACYGEEDQQPTQDDLIPALQNLFMLLEILTADNADEELPLIRTYFGEISCLIDTYDLQPTDLPTQPGETDDGGTGQPTSTQSGGEGNGGTGQPTTSPTGTVNCTDLASITVAAFYDCITSEDLKPIFGLGPIGDQGEIPEVGIVSKRCVGFVVDTSGSMADEIVEVRNNIKNFVDTQENLPACYVLIDFNDYDSSNPDDNVGTAKVYDPSIDYGADGSSLVRTGGLPVYGVQELKADVDALNANGGYDCPEYGMTGILKALEAIGTVEGLVLPVQGNLHHLITLTDASAKDDYRYQEALVAANNARATVHFFYSGSGCGGTFGNFETVRVETGGIAITSFDDFDDLSEFIQLYSDAVEALSPESTTGRKKRTAEDIFSEAAPSHSVYINFLTDNLAVLAQTTQSQVIVSKPDGQQEILTTSGILALYTDENPMPGLWTFSVSTGTLQVVISAPVLLEIDIIYTATSENGDLLPTQDIPYACDTGTILVSSPQFNKISFNYSLYLNLLDSAGNILQQAGLEECDGILSGVVTFPSTPMVFYQLQGHDIGANPFTKTFTDYDVTFRHPNLEASLLNTNTITVNPGNTSFSKIELYYNQSYGADLNLQFFVTTSSSDLVTFFLDVPQSIKASTKMYAVIETQASVNVHLGTSDYYVTTGITETCTGSTVTLTSQVIAYQPVPLAVENTTTQMTNDRNLKVSWQEPDISTPSDIWQYRIHLDYDNSTFWQVDVASTVREYTLVGLQPYQQVYVIVEARSASSETLAKTAQLRFRSREDVPGPVASVTFEVVNNNTAWIQWDPPSTPNGVILYYVVRLVDVAYAIELSSSHVDVFQDRVITYEQLGEYVRYEAEVIGATSEGLGESQRRQFYTAEGEPNASPRNIRIRPITTTSANISWDPPPIQNRRGFIVRYDIIVSYYEKSGEYQSRSFYTLGEDNTSIRVEDLPQYGQVSVAVSSATEKGSGPASPPTTGIIELPPSAPSSLRGEPRGSSVFLTWLPPDYPNGILLEYTVYFQTEDNPNQMEEGFQELKVMINELEDVDSPSAQIDGLTAPAAYSFTVTAVNSAGEGAKSTQISVTLTDNSWIIILCGVLGGVLVIVCVICCIILLCCFCVVRQRSRKKKHGVFEVFQNEDEKVDGSTTNPMFEQGEPNNVYEDIDKVQEEGKTRSIPIEDKINFYEQFHREDDVVDRSATNPIFGVGIDEDDHTDIDPLVEKEEKPKRMPYQEMETEDEFQTEQQLRSVPQKEMETEDEFQAERKLRSPPQKKTEAQLEMERILKTVPDKIGHYEDIITKIGTGETAASMTSTQANYINVGDSVIVSTKPQSQEHDKATSVEADDIPT